MPLSRGVYSSLTTTVAPHWLAAIGQMLRSSARAPRINEISDTDVSIVIKYWLACVISICRLVDNVSET
jgi:hypothetical protein